MDDHHNHSHSSHDHGGQSTSFHDSFHASSSTVHSHANANLDMAGSSNMGCDSRVAAPPRYDGQEGHVGKHHHQHHNQNRNHDHGHPHPPLYRPNSPNNSSTPVTFPSPIVLYTNQSYGAIQPRVLNQEPWCPHECEGK